MGETDTKINLNQKRPTVIMMAGLQGSGKTTTCGKLARFLNKKRGMSPLLVAADVQRPAAIEQLKIIGNELGYPVYSEEGGRPPKICKRAIAYAEKHGNNVVILDTAGRLHIDAPLMAELREVVALTKPEEIFLVCDAMLGQDAVNSAKEFNNQLEISGIVFTKLDGDARGGAVMSIRAITGKPVKFVGVGEKLDKIEEFRPAGMAERILGMGVIMKLVEDARDVIKEEDALAMQEKLISESFTFEDFLKQLGMVEKLGGLKSILKYVPGMSGMMKDTDFDESDIKRIRGMIHSMTPEERQNPEVIDGSRRRRIANGSAATVQDINDLLKQYREMKNMVRQMKEGGMFGKLKGMVGGGPIPGLGPSDEKREQKRKLREKRKKEKKLRKKQKRRNR
jgi:signal recognition particle subunit SRP54